MNAQFSVYAAAMAPVFAWVAYASAFVILAESLNKLERSRFQSVFGLPLRQQVALVLKIAAWLLLAWGSGGVLADLFHFTKNPPDMREACFLLGFAVLIVRTRVKEG